MANQNDKRPTDEDQASFDRAALAHERFLDSIPRKPQHDPTPRN